MGIGIGLGAFAQGLGEGYDAGTRTAMAQQKWKLEKPKLEAEAADAERKKVFNQYMSEGLQKLQAEAAGGEIQNEDGTVTQRPPMNEVQRIAKMAEITNESMFKAGIIDFDRITKARELSKMVESEGLMEATQYALMNPNDQAGIKQRFNSQGKIKIGDDVTLAVETGDSGRPTVVGYRDVGGRQVKVFDTFELMMPYISKEKFAEIKATQANTEAKIKSEERQTDKRVGAQYAIAGMQADRDDKRFQRQLDLADKKEQAQIAREERGNETKFWNDLRGQIITITNNSVTSTLRGSAQQINPERVNQIEAEVAAGAYALARQFPQLRDNPLAAVNAARQKVYKDYGVNLADPLKPTQKK